MILSGARDRDWTGDLFLTKEALCLWATWAWTVILTVYNRLIKKTEKDKLFEHLLCIRNQKAAAYLKMEPATGFEPVTCWLQISCSTNWATPALCFSGAGNEGRTRNLQLGRLSLCQLSYSRTFQFNCSSSLVHATQRTFSLFLTFFALKLSISF